MATVSWGMNGGSFQEKSSHIWTKTVPVRDGTGTVWEEATATTDTVRGAGSLFADYS